MFNKNYYYYYSFLQNVRSRTNQIVQIHIQSPNLKIVFMFCYELKLVL